MDPKNQLKDIPVDLAHPATRLNPKIIFITGMFVGASLLTAFDYGMQFTQKLLNPPATVNTASPSPTMAKSPTPISPAVDQDIDTTELLPTSQELTQTQTETGAPVDSDFSIGIITRLSQTVNAETLNGYSLDIDYVQWLSDSDTNNNAASRACVQDGACDRSYCTDAQGQIRSCLPNNYYIRNQNPQIRSFPVKSDAQVLVYDYQFNPDTGKKIIELEEFITLYNSGAHFNDTTLYWIKLKDNIVQSIAEQYRP